MRAFLAFALFVPSATFAQTAELPSGKLPATAAPTAYRVDMTILPEKPRFSGHTEIDVDLKQAASAIYLHGRDLHVTRAVVKIGNKEMPVTFAQKTPSGLAQVQFGKTVNPGKLTLKFDYDAAFATGPAGLYHLNIASAWYSWTQFESIDARSAFPSFDEPGFKTPFTVSITTKPGFAAISNAPEIGKGKRKGALVRHDFIATKPLPTYLIAFVTGPFAVAETVVPPTPQRKAPLPLRVVGTKPNAGQLKFALDESGKIVALLERYFNQPFPYPKLDQIGSPVMPGAMENAGADIYGDGILFLDENAASDEKRTFGMVVAHELSHQWFGDLVTPAWWDDIWLNESFANWMGYRIGDEWRPGLNIEVDGIAEGFEAMDVDALTAGRPIHERITKDADIDAAFDQITYGKGGQVIAMIADYLGDEKFRDGVRLHMQRHTYGNATTDEFFASLADAAHDPRVLASLRSFVDQQGVPLVTLHRGPNGYTATQQRYAYFGENAPATQWMIPFCVRRAAARTCTLLDGPEMAIETAAGGGVLVPNAGGWGYYRFDLDAADWDALIAATPTLPEPEALAVTDSLWAGFYAGKPYLPKLLAFAKAAGASPSTKIALDNAQRLQGLDKGGLLSDAALPGFRALIDGIYAPQLAKLGFDPALGAFASDDADRKQLRAELVEIVADAGRNAAARAKLTTALDAYLAGDAKALDPEYGQLAATIAVQDRGLPFAKMLAIKALGAPGPIRQLALRAIAASDSPEVARWFLQEFNDPKIEGKERLKLAGVFLHAPRTRDLAFTYMIAHFGDYSKPGSGGIFSGSTAKTFESLCSAAQADQVDAKLRPLLAQDSTLGLDRTLDKIRNCARFRDAKAVEISAAFAK